MDVKVQIPMIWDVQPGPDVPMRVTLYPTGHLAVDVDGFVQQFGYQSTPPDMGKEVRTYLASTYANKVIDETDGRRIADEVACIARAWISRNTK